MRVKPWNAADEKKVCTFVTKQGMPHTAASREAMEKALKRPWSQISSRIKELVKRGELTLPAEAPPPPKGASAATAGPQFGAPASSGVKRPRSEGTKKGGKTAKAKEEPPPPPAAAAAAGPKLDKRAAKALKGKYIEIYWDGEGQWFEAEVLSFLDKAGMHLVRYTADFYECEEELMKGETLWRQVMKTTARGAKARAVAPPPPGAPPIE